MVVNVSFLAGRNRVNKTAKLGEASGDAHNQGGWLVLQYLLNKWVTEGAYKGVASNPHDSTLDV